MICLELKFLPDGPRGGLGAPLDETLRFRRKARRADAFDRRALDAGWPREHDGLEPRLQPSRDGVGAFGCNASGKISETLAKWCKFWRARSRPSLQCQDLQTQRHFLLTFENSAIHLEFQHFLQTVSKPPR